VSGGRDPCTCLVAENQRSRLRVLDRRSRARKRERRGRRSRAAPRDDEAASGEQPQHDDGLHDPLIRWRGTACHLVVCSSSLSGVIPEHWPSRVTSAPKPVSRGRSRSRGSRTTLQLHVGPPGGNTSTPRSACRASSAVAGFGAGGEPGLSPVPADASQEGGACDSTPLSICT
jgi:hypothetical protein